LALVAIAGPAAAEPFLDGFTGRNFTRDADVHVKQPAAGNDFTVHDLSFSPGLSEGAPYYGIRAGYFFPGLPWLGVAVEFFHFKIVGETGDTRRISGTRGGAPIDARVPVDTVMQRFENSNGETYITVDVLARYGFLEDRQDFPHGRLQLYAGLGVGPVVTYTYSTIDGVARASGYELGGGGIQVFTGARFLLFKYGGLFIEGKTTYSRLTVGVARGGHADVTEQSAHLVGGITLTMP
jgi:hypothetical protein